MKRFCYYLSLLSSSLLLLARDNPEILRLYTEWGPKLLQVNTQWASLSIFMLQKLFLLFNCDMQDLFFLFIYIFFIYFFYFISFIWYLLIIVYYLYFIFFIIHIFSLSFLKQFQNRIKKYSHFNNFGLHRQQSGRGFLYLRALFPCRHFRSSLTAEVGQNVKHIIFAFSSSPLTVKL